MDASTPKRHQLLAPKEDYLRPAGAVLGQPTEAGRFADIAFTPAFKRAVEVALLEFVTRQKPTNSVEATVAGIELQGAKAVLNILLNLGVDDPPLRSNPSPIPQLNRV